MRSMAIALVLGVANLTVAADVESRVLTHYVPQDMLEAAVRKEGWTPIPLNVKDGVRKGDVVRIWAGGSIDRGGDVPGENVVSPHGLVAGSVPGEKLALSPQPDHAYALLFKTDGPSVWRSQAAGKPLEIKLTRDKERLWVGFNDVRGHFRDNHLGKGRHHEFDPLWVRIEVVRIVVD